MCVTMYAATRCAAVRRLQTACRRPSPVSIGHLQARALPRELVRREHLLRCSGAALDARQGVHHRAALARDADLNVALARLPALAATPWRRRLPTVLAPLALAARQE